MSNTDARHSADPNAEPSAVAEVQSQADPSMPDEAGGPWEATDNSENNEQIADAPQPETTDGAEGPTGDLDGEPALTVEQLQARLSQALSEVESEREAALRTRADMENLRRRATRDVENAHKFGVERLVNELLPVIDSLELGLQATEQEGASVESLREGGELTLKMLKGALEKFELQVVDPIDVTFDPEFHQAMSMQEVSDKSAGQILQVVQKGYTLSGRLVRPAMVIVAK